MYWRCAAGCKNAALEPTAEDAEDAGVRSLPSPALPCLKPHVQLAAHRLHAHLLDKQGHRWHALPRCADGMRSQKRAQFHWDKRSKKYVKLQVS